MQSLGEDQILSKAITIRQLAKFRCVFEFRAWLRIRLIHHRDEEDAEVAQRVE